MFAASVLYSCS